MDALRHLRTIAALAVGVSLFLFGWMFASYRSFPSRASDLFTVPAIVLLGCVFAIFLFAYQKSGLPIRVILVDVVPRRDVLVAAAVIVVGALGLAYERWHSFRDVPVLAVDVPEGQTYEGEGCEELMRYGRHRRGPGASLSVTRGADTCRALEYRWTHLNVSLLVLASGGAWFSAAFMAAAVRRRQHDF